MQKKDISEFFECLGEVVRDIAAIEFIMRCAIAKKDGEESKFPKPPYAKGKVYKVYPKAFSIIRLEEIIEEFNDKFPKIKIPEEFKQLRHAFAHGIMAEIDGDGMMQLVKFKTQKNRDLEVEFSMILTLEKMKELRIVLNNLRKKIAIDAGISK
jgi:hypothetical protein